MNLPYDVVKQHFTLPFELYPFQVPIVNELAVLPRAGFYLDPGVGKTACATASALYKKATRPDNPTVICPVPPILLNMWSRWLAKITHKNGKPLDVVVYRGTPAKRKGVQLKGDFILVSLPIFKIEYERFCDAFTGKDPIVLIDEATAIKSISSANHKKVRDFAAGRDLMLLTGTPLSSVMDGYAYCKLLAPSIYRNLKHFMNLHVDEVDFFDKPIKWKNLDLLADNMRVNSVRVLKREVLKELPPITYTPIYYELEPDHYRLYKKLVDEQLLPLRDGGKIDATQATALYHAVQQIVINYDYFSEKPDVRSAGYDLIDEVMEELGDKKLIVVANYKMTNRHLVEYFKKWNGTVLFGDLTDKQKDAAIDKFIGDPSCRVMGVQPQSAGLGVDGLQSVCSDMLFIEAPVVPMQFHQTVARLERDGQRNNINVRIGIAERTIQGKLHKQLLEKDALVNKVQGSWEDLRDAMYGG